MIQKTLVLLSMAVMMFAYSNIDGGYGLIRTESADNGSAGHFHVGLFMRGFSETRDVTLVGDSTGRAVNAGGDVFLALGYAFTDNFAFNVGTQYHGDGVNWENSTYNRASLGFGDTKVAVKLTFGPKNSKFALNPYITLPTGSDRSTALTQRNYPIFGDALGNDGGVFRYFSSGAVDMGINGLASFKMGKLNLDLNLGYLDRNKNDAEWGYMNNQTMYRGALSLDLGGVVPFVEVGAVDYNGEDKFFSIFDDKVWGPNEGYITPGLSFRPGNFAINLALDVRGFWPGVGENTEAFPTPITDSANITRGWGVAPAWAAILGVSYCVDFIGEKPQTGLITGTVSDASTREAIATDVVIKKDGVPVQTVFSTNGVFRVDKLEPGLYTLDAAPEYYYPGSVECAVKAGETTPVVIELNLIPTDGELIIRVIDIGTREPVEAEVTINGEPQGKTSFVSKTVKAGSYRIQAQGDEAVYLPFDQTVIVQAGIKNEIEVALVKKTFKIVLPQVYFEFDKADLKPESYPVLDGAAITIAKVFAGNATVIIEVQGHTDWIGTDSYNLTLSQKRAETVKAYLVDRHNLDGNRLNAKGYGESNPIASNNTDEGRANNRRVEFVIFK